MSRLNQAGESKQQVAKEEPMKRGIVLKPMLQAPLLAVAALVLFTPGLRAGTYSFQKLNNNGDLPSTSF